MKDRVEIIARTERHTRFSDAEKAAILAEEDIATENPERAISFVDELREAARRIADLARGYPLVPRYEHYGIAAS